LHQWRNLLLDAKADSPNGRFSPYQGLPESEQNLLWWNLLPKPVALCTTCKVHANELDRPLVAQNIAQRVGPIGGRERRAADRGREYAADKTKLGR
jgi:hypothetical protein